MAPIKFEEHIKDKLEQRDIQPSEGSWERLSNRLDEDDTSSRSRHYWWLGVAAMLVGGFLALTFLLNSDTSNGNATIVETDSTEDIIEEKSSETEAAPIQMVEQDHSETNDVNALSETSESGEQKRNPPQTRKAQDDLVTQIPVQSKSADEVVAVQSQSEQDVLPTDRNLNAVEVTSYEVQKINDVVAQIKTITEKNDSITNKEIDALLAQAQKDIALENLLRSDAKTVDADALLESVEFDLEKSFRDKVFEALKSSYETVKTAVAERNN